VLSEKHLRPYQHLGTDFLLSLPRCALWAGMGMGKGVMTLTAIDRLFMAGESSPVLVLGPLRVATGVWPQEAAKWRHLKHIEVHTMAADATACTKAVVRSLKSANESVYTCNYDNLPWLVESFGSHWPFRTVVADESPRLKSFRLRQGGSRAQALAGVAWSYVDRFIQLTGRPAPNGLQDLWGQMWFLDQGTRLGRTWTGFQERWFKPSYDGYGSEPLPHAEGEILSRLSDICLTIDPKDWFDLQEPLVNTIRVQLPAKARKQYDEMERNYYVELEAGGVAEARNAGSKTMKLRQMASGFVFTTEGESAWQEVHQAKLDALDSVLQEAGGAPVMVAYHFKPDLARLKKAFPKGREFDKNPKTKDDFCAGKIPLLFVHPQSAGHGVDGMQNACNIIAFFGHDWKLDDRLQVIERIGPVRQMQAGKNRLVFVHNIVVEDTVEEVMMDTLYGKKTVEDAILVYMKRRHS
jgi:SNF2 family DNA or RNA helicase